MAFDYAAIGMALVFPTGRWHRVNRSLCEILGYPEEELLAGDFKEFIHPDDRLAAMAKLDQLLKGQCHDLSDRNPVHSQRWSRGLGSLERVTSDC